MSKMVFVDTSAWIALTSKSDQYHDDAVSFYGKQPGLKLVVSNLVLGETYTWLRYKAGYDQAASFLAAIAKKAELDQVVIIYSDAHLEKQAAALLERYRDHRFSLTDAVSFSIMGDYKIKDAFAYDRHFVIAGFNLVSEL